MLRSIKVMVIRAQYASNDSALSSHHKITISWHLLQFSSGYYTRVTLFTFVLYMVYFTALSVVKTTYHQTIGWFIINWERMSDRQLYYWYLYKLQKTKRKRLSHYRWSPDQDLSLRHPKCKAEMPPTWSWSWVSFHCTIQDLLMHSSL